MRGFASIASPLHTLAHKNVRFSWSDECQIAFDTLKGALISAPILGLPIDDAPYLLDNDASLESIGVVLSQIQDGRQKVIAYASKLLSPAESQYCVTRRQLLAVVFYLTLWTQTSIRAGLRYTVQTARCHTRRQTVYLRYGT